MPHGTKIATCSYCGTRAALVLTGGGRHELSCASCGAPLHQMKALKLQKPPKPERKPPKPARRPKKRKAARLWAEVFDLIEDVFD